jgi:hypothetical protein
MIALYLDDYLPPVFSKKYYGPVEAGSKGIILIFNDLLHPAGLHYSFAYNYKHL